MSAKDAGPDDLDYALQILSIGMGRDGVRHYEDSGGLWFGRNQGFADATFVDWGLARAVAVILTAVNAGRLVKAEPAEPKPR